MCRLRANLSAVFDHFVADTTLLDDRLMMETAGAQCLLLAGFFEDQMRRRHNIRWYAELGASFFRRAALHEQSLDKARLLDAIARRFRAVASAPRPAESRTAGPAVSADPARATRGPSVGREPLVDWSRNHECQTASRPHHHPAHRGRRTEGRRNHHPRQRQGESRSKAR